MMASLEQQELSTYIKNVHKKLREDSKTIGYEKAWENHCRDNETLSKYAESMKTLAVDYWQKNEINDPKVQSRINWVYTSSTDYFIKGGIEYQRKREFDIASKNELVCAENDVDFEKNENKLKLLDVGSCYNPFAKFPELDVTAIDISPANASVLQCDFLYLSITEKPPVNGLEITQLQKSSFHIVTFCLLLEYLPSPVQRLQCCRKAYELLKPEGLLVVITPDSKHVGSNAKIMKSWRYVLAKVGFCRIKYEKLTYLHCMLFRRSLSASVAKRWAELNAGKGLYEEMLIPQDVNNQK